MSERKFLHVKYERAIIETNYAGKLFVKLLVGKKWVFKLFLDDFKSMKPRFTNWDSHYIVILYLKYDD